MHLSGPLIFLITYLLISARRLDRLGLDRPAAALLGAVACVGFGALTPAQATAAVEGDTILLLLGVMGMGAFLVIDDLFGVVEDRLARWGDHPARLLGAVVWGSGTLAALITNDAVCVLGAPLVVRLIRRHDLPPAPMLLALATGANTGSVATLVGNPQNMLCGLLGRLSFLDYAITMLPVALAALAINHLALALLYRHALTPRTPTTPHAPPPAPRPLTPRHAVTLGVLALTAAAYMAGASMAWTAAAGFVTLMVLHRRDARAVWGHIDWSLLLFFAGLFVVVEALRHSGATALLFAHLPLTTLAQGPAPTLTLSGVFLIGSNLVSNVPFILVVRDQITALPDPTSTWKLLAMASTFAGNLTLLGSAANIIVAESSRDVGSFGFLEHARVGVPLTLATTLLGAWWLAW